jgi:hypothetical protein
MPILVEDIEHCLGAFRELQLALSRRDRDDPEKLNTIAVGKSIHSAGRDPSSR